MGTNFLLQALSPEDLALLRPHMSSIPLNVGAVIYEPGSEITHVWFPLSGICSLVTVLLDGSHVESSAIGRESAVGFAEACGGGVSHSLVLVQMGGEALRVPAARYRQAFDGSASLRRAVAQHTELLLAEARQEIACHARHQAEARLARWLLVCRDKSGSDDFQMTQEFLATMVATQRTTVSGIAAQMKEAGMIHYARGRVRICDAAALERQACECYPLMKHFRELMGQPGS